MAPESLQHPSVWHGRVAKRSLQEQQTGFLGVSRLQAFGAARLKESHGRSSQRAEQSSLRWEEPRRPTLDPSGQQVGPSRLKYLLFIYLALCQVAAQPRPNSSPLSEARGFAKKNGPANRHRVLCIAARETAGLPICINAEFFTYIVPSRAKHR